MPLLTDYRAFDRIFPVHKNFNISSSTHHKRLNESLKESSKQLPLIMFYEDLKILNSWLSMAESEIFMTYQ